MVRSPTSVRFVATEGAVVPTSTRVGPAWLRAVREIVLLGGLFLGYKAVRQAVRGRIDVAFANAEHVLRFERWLHLDFELEWQRAILGSRDLVVALNRYYVSVHFTATLIFLVWIYALHRGWYPHIRRLVIGTTGLALVLHVAFPLAPPRMLPGFVDTMAVFGPSAYGNEQVAAFANQYAAMPSVHFAWAVLVAYGVIRASRFRLRWLILAHPVITFAAIVLTANHYWLDAAVSLVVLGIAFAAEASVIRLFAHLRARPGEVGELSESRESAPASAR
jgi:hypothetical protein